MDVMIERYNFSLSNSGIIGSSTHGVSLGGCTSESGGKATNQLTKQVSLLLLSSGTMIDFWGFYLFSRMFNYSDKKKECLIIV